MDGLGIDLQDKVVIVTGGGTGIGRATGLLFAQFGADVVVAGRTEAALLETVELIHDGTGRKALAVVTDVRSQDQVQGLVDRVIGTFGRIDVIVNNAGGTYLRPLPDVSLAEWQNNVALNLNSVFMMMQAALPHLKDSRGTVVNVSSSAASSGFRSGGAYSAAKSGVEMLTRVAGAELGCFGVRVNCVAPGMVRSEGAERGWRVGGMDVAAESAKIPVGRVGETYEIARAIVFLASEASSFITGEVLHVDGGPRMDGPDSVGG